MYVDVTVDRADRSWRGKVGAVTKLLSDKGLAPMDTLAFVCGPEIMMRYSIMSLNDLGVTNERIYVSMERNMKCAIGYCGHCQFGGTFVCRDGPVFRYDRVAERFNIREL
jgi:NAD(P)H-flavin reductase